MESESFLSVMIIWTVLFALASIQRMQDDLIDTEVLNLWLSILSKLSEFYSDLREIWLLFHRSIYFVLSESRIAYIPLLLLISPLIGRLLGLILQYLSHRERTSRLIPGMTLVGHFAVMVITVQPFTLLVDHLGPVFGMNKISNSVF